MTIFEQMRRHSLRERRRLILAIVILVVVMLVMLIGMGEIMSKITTTAREEVPVVMVGVWPLYGIGPVHFMFIQ